MGVSVTLCEHGPSGVIEADLFPELLTVKDDSQISILHNVSPCRC